MAKLFNVTLSVCYRDLIVGVDAKSKKEAIEKAIDQASEMYAGPIKFIDCTFITYWNKNKEKEG